MRESQDKFKLKRIRWMARKLVKKYMSKLWMEWEREIVSKHAFYFSSQWSTGIGPIPQYVLADLYAWLESHNEFTPLTTFSSSSYTSNTTKIEK
jgi:hypothetical protein